MKAALLESNCVVVPEGRAANLKVNLARGLPVLAQDAPEHERPLLIVGSGPSISDPAILGKIRDWPGDIWAINGAYDYLLESDIVSEGFFGIDPLPGLADYVRNAQEYTTFYIASMCDPSVFDRLHNRKVHMWHACAESASIFPDGNKVIYGGTTAATRAPFLAYAFGFRDINLIGMDASYAKTGPYCYPWGSYATDINDKVLSVMINGEGPFSTDLGLLKQVTQLGTMLNSFNKKREMLKIHPAGLMGAFMRAPMMDDSSIEMVPYDELFKTVTPEAA